MANIRYVDVDADAGGNGTTNALTGANCAYKSLTIWEAARQATLSAVEECICESSHANHTADTTAVVIAGWTASATNYIDIKTSAGARHGGVWDATKYRLEVTNANVIQISESYTRIDRLQLATISPAANGRLGIYMRDGQVGIRISNCLIKGHAHGTYTQTGIQYTNDNTEAIIWNTIIYDIATISGNYGVFVNYNVIATLYNNTIVGCNVGIQRSQGTVIAKNNILSGCVTATAGLTGGANIDYNTTNLASLGYTAQAGDRVSQTFSFTNGYHLAVGDTGAKDYGLSDPGSGLFSDDIDGDARGATWDIGADEYVAAGGVAPTSALRGPLFGPMGGPI